MDKYQKEIDAILAYDKAPPSEKNRIFVRPSPGVLDAEVLPMDDYRSLTTYNRKQSND